MFMRLVSAFSLALFTGSYDLIPPNSGQLPELMAINVASINWATNRVSFRQLIAVQGDLARVVAPADAGTVAVHLMHDSETGGLHSGGLLAHS